MHQVSNGSGLVIRLTLTLLAVFFFPLLFAIWLDRQLGTSPFITIFAIIFGTTFGTLAITRQVAGVYNRLPGEKS
jgi:F0F1-type ATP synthase assembly protein I